MKILFVSYHYWPPAFGGELLITIERFQSLVQLGHRVTVLTSGTYGFPDHEVINGIEIFRSPKINSSKFGRGFRRLLFPYWVNLIMRKIDFDIVHFSGTGGVEPITTNFGNWLTCKAAKKYGAKLIWVHSLADNEKEMYSEKGLANNLRKLTLKQMDSIVSVSPALHEAVKKHFPDRSYCIPNGIRDDLFIPFSDIERDKIRNANDVSKDHVIFTYLGSVCTRKGFDLLTEAFSNLGSMYQNWLLWVIGPYSTEDNQNLNDNEITQIINNLSSSYKRIRFWGRIDNRKQLAELLASSDVFVFPSRKEGMPLAPLEAMAAGVPVIISRIPGVTDLANIEGKTGFYMKVGDAQSLKTLMIKLGTDKGLRQGMGKAAHERILAEFGWANFINKWEQMYLSLLENDAH